MLARVIYILKKVDTGLLFSLPLGISHLVLSLSLLLHKFIYKSLVGGLIALGLLIVLLKYNNFISPLSFFGLLKLLHCLFSFDVGSEKNLISISIVRFLDMP